MDTSKTKLSFLIAIGLALFSGLMLMLSMPGYDIPLLAWVALVPLLVVADNKQGLPKYILFNVTGLVWSIGCHNWFPDVLGAGLGLFLMLASGLMYGFFLQTGHDLMQKFRHRRFHILIMPTVFTALEWLRFVLPVTKEWWIEVLAKSQWTVPANLQIISVAGFSGLSFLIVLANTAVAAVVLTLLRRREWNRVVPAALIIPIAVSVWGYAVVGNADRSNTIAAAANSDLANQDADIVKLGGGTTAGDGYLADTEEMSRAIFDVNVALTIEAVRNGSPAFVVWGENEFTSYENEDMMRMLKTLAESTGTYIAADIVWNSANGLHDTAVLIGPDGREAGKTAKINITSGEKQYGFVPGKEWGNVFETAYGPVGLAVCWDRHVVGVIRSLARNGAKLVLIPVDDDFNANALFPYYAASDTVFRAVENRVAIVAGTTAGISQIITPYGEVTAASGINTREVIAGDTFTVDGDGGTIYSRFGDWFGLLTAACFAALVFAAARAGRKQR